MEVIVAIAILAILAAIVIPNYTKIVRSISKAKCLANMRSLHGSFSSAIQDYGMWPQAPQDLDANTSEYEDFWLNTMKPYVVSQEVWLCPVLKAARITDSAGNPLRMHYIPTQFDANPISPRRWSKQPWLIEMGDAHGSGALVLFPDGSIKGMDEIVAGAGK